MADLPSLGRVFLLFGVMFAAIGLVLLLGPKVPWLGRLPGDLVIQRESFTLYVPLASCLLISVVLSVVLWLFGSHR